MTIAAQGDTVKVHYTGTLDDGTVFDSSAGRDPIEFTIGSETVIPGFENAVVGLAVGDKTTVVIGAEDAYGPRSDEKILVVDRSWLPAEPEPSVGMMLQGQSPEGVVMFTITGVEDEKVTLDGNHPLAGKQLTFDIELAEVVAG
ncbi:MAG: peptidylprolyl isomerase [Gemmatimonadales bacterium]|nr:peptidylprolyl isomerase [Gemmatimonadales bacterium]